jgi:hypothetical protein
MREMGETMKKKVILIVFFVIVILLIGLVVYETLRIRSISESYKIEITINDSYYINSIEKNGNELNADHGFKFFIIDITLKNIGEEFIQVNSLFITISNNENSVYNSSYEVNNFLTNVIDIKHVYPDESYQGKLGFVLKEERIVKNLHYDDYANELIIEL